MTEVIQILLTIFSSRTGILQANTNEVKRNLEHCIHADALHCCRLIGCPA